MDMQKDSEKPSEPTDFEKQFIKEIEELFSKLDEVKDGKLTKQELIDGIKELPTETIGSNEEKVNKIMEQFDNDKDGTIDLDEFKTLFLY